MSILSKENKGIAAYAISDTRRILHWVSAILVIAMLIIGLRMTDSDLSTPEAISAAMWKFSLHKTIGVLVLLITLIRFIAMLRGKGFVHSDHKPIETIAASAIQGYFLMALVVLPITGLAMHVLAEGAAPIWILPDDFLHKIVNAAPRPDLVPLLASVHEFIAKGMIIALLAHVGGALKHLIMDNDGTLKRMVTGYATNAGHDPRGAPSHRVRVGQRFGVVMLGMVAAAGAGSHLKHLQDIEGVTPLSATGGDWVSVADQSSLKIDAIQGGDAFTGSFANFDVRLTGKEKPEAIEVTIDSASFSSGLEERDSTVKGSDWLDVSTFALASWKTRDIDKADTGGFTGSGTLTIRGVSAPVSIGFTLTPEGESMRLAGTAAFDRFKIQLGRGDFANEDSAGREIKVQFDVLLEQAP